MTYSKVKECINFSSWFFCRWRIRRGWDGPYVLLYEVGTRILGFEFVRTVRHTTEDE